MENFQRLLRERALENGEYLRSVESATEDGYSFVDGRANNDSEKIRKDATKQEETRRQEQITKEAAALRNDKDYGYGKDYAAPAASQPAFKPLEQRVSVLKRLREKQAQIAGITNYNPPEQLLTEELERTRK